MGATTEGCCAVVVVTVYFGGNTGICALVVVLIDLGGSAGGCADFDVLVVSTDLGGTVGTGSCAVTVDFGGSVGGVVVVVFAATLTSGLNT